jgi:hypothetical protein
VLGIMKNHQYFTDHCFNIQNIKLWIHIVSIETQKKYFMKLVVLESNKPKGNWVQCLKHFFTKVLEKYGAIMSSVLKQEKHLSKSLTDTYFKITKEVLTKITDKVFYSI